jgi:hypothetical protein
MVRLEGFMTEQSNTTAMVYYALLREQVHMASSRKVVRVVVERCSFNAERLGRYIKWIPGIRREILENLLVLSEHPEDLPVYFHLSSTADPRVDETWFEVAPESYSSYPRAQKDAMRFVFSRVAFSPEDPGYAVVYCSWERGQIRRVQRSGPDWFVPFGEWARGDLFELRRTDQGWTRCGEHMLWVC